MVIQKKPIQIKVVDDFIAGGNDANYVPDEYGSVTSPDTDTQPSTSTETDTPTYTYTVPSTDTLLDIKPDELMIRTTCYLTKIQSDYVKKMAKKHKVKESEIIRLAVNNLMKK